MPSAPTATPPPRATPSSHHHTPAVPEKVKTKARTTHPLQAHQTQASKTLARKAVSKPQPHSSKAKARVQPALDSVSALSKRHAPLTSYARVSADRLRRANHTPPSTLIHHFTSPAHTEAHQPTIQPVAVQPHVVVREAPQPALSAHQQHLDHALRSATSHTQPAIKPARRRRRVINFSNRSVALIVAVVAVVVVGGFVFTQNVPQIDTRLASLHAGFAVSVPSYQPAGFAFVDHVQASPGQATVSYRSTTDDGQFSIAQETSNWNDKTLHAYVASTGLSTQAWQDRGRTVYLYGSNMTWISNGIWYQISNHADLSSTQLLDIATSM
jgi:hypothetical protein